MKTTPQLTQAIENLYIAFEGYRRRSNTEACPCCHTSEQEQRLHSKPLRKIEAETLREYAFSALYTWGTEDDFKHFLPRILELLVTLDDPGLDFMDPEVLFPKLPYTSWWLWPKEERDAISQFMRAMWHAALNTEPEDLDFDGVAQWLCALAGCEDDLSPYLQMWLEDPSSMAHRNLAKVMRQLGVPYATRLPWAYWDKRRAQWEQFVEWMRSSAVLKKMETAVERWTDEPFSDELFDAAVFLQP